MAILLVGAIATNVAGKRLLQRAEWLLLHVPLFRSIYAPVKQLVVAFSPDNEYGFKRVVMVEDTARGYLLGIPDARVHPGLRQGPETLIAVYVPTNHLYLGDILICQRDRVSYPDITVEQGIRIFLTGGLARTTGADRRPGALQLVAADSVPARASPSSTRPTSTRSRSATGCSPPQLLAAADLWLFVTSAARYADQVPWDFLKAAAERSTAVAIVLDRTAARARVEEVSGHLARMLDGPRPARTRRCSRSRRAPSTTTGCCPPRRCRRSAAGSTGSPPTPPPGRPWSSRRSTAPSARCRAAPHDVADAAAAQVAWRAGCARTWTRAYDEALARGRRRVRRRHACCAARCSPAGRSSSAPASCSARWRPGSAGCATGSSAGCAASRSRPSGSPSPSSPGLETLILEHAETAAERAAPPGARSTGGPARSLEDAGRDLGRASRDFRARAERAVRDWQHGVLEMVRTEGADKRTTARFLAFGVNGLSVALMVVVFAHTAGVTGAEVGHRRRQRRGRARSCSRRCSATRRSAGSPSRPRAGPRRAGRPS